MRVRTWIKELYEHKQVGLEQVESGDDNTLLCINLLAK